VTLKRYFFESEAKKMILLDGTPNKKKMCEQCQLLMAWQSAGAYQPESVMHGLWHFSYFLKKTLFLALF